MKQHVLNTYANTLASAQQLVADIPCERFAELPFEGAMHPAWILTHLCLASGMGADHLGGSSGEFAGVPSGWIELAMPGTSPGPDRDAYATKDELLSELARVHGVLAGHLEAADDAKLATEFPNPEYRAFFPTIGDAAFYLMAFHEGWHLGQLSTWRRAIGFGSVGGA